MRESWSGSSPLCRFLGEPSSPQRRLDDLIPSLPLYRHNSERKYYILQLSVKKILVRNNIWSTHIKPFWDTSSYVDSFEPLYINNFILIFILSIFNISLRSSNNYALCLYQYIKYEHSATPLPHNITKSKVLFSSLHKILTFHSLQRHCKTYQT